MQSKQRLNLTPTMIRTMAWFRRDGGIVVRYPGGFWLPAGYSGFIRAAGTTTIQALVDRGLLKYTRHKCGNRMFPVEARVICPICKSIERKKLCCSIRMTGDRA